MKYKNILVALDRSAFDRELIRHSRSMAEKLSLTKVSFVHVVPYLLPAKFLHDGLESLIGQDPDLLERVERNLAAQIDPIYQSLGGSVEVEYIIKHGHPQEELLALIGEQEPDLLVVGKKLVTGGSGVLARRVARKTNCAVLFVTEGAAMDWKHFLVPLDFSQYSMRALKTALGLREGPGKPASITALSVIDVPASGYKMNRNRAAIVDRLKTATTKEFFAFMDQNQIKRTDVRLRLCINNNFNVAAYIRETAAEEKSDLIVMGAKGHSRFENFLLGSVTEKLVTSDCEVPVLIIR